MRTARVNAVTVLAAVIGSATLVATPDAGADSGVGEVRDYGGGCVVDPANQSVTMNSLTQLCTLDQQNAIFSDAGPGNVPRGVTDGVVVTPAYIADIAPGLWIGKTFYTGPDGGYLMNRVTGAGVEAIRADVYTAPAITDGAPTWALNYAPSPIPQIYDEIREITPGLWFGYSWRRDTATPTLLLTFALN